MGTANGAPGGTVLVSITSSAFTYLSAQGSIHWDPSVAQFVDVEQFGLPNLSSANFGTTMASSGTLTFSWDDPAGTGVTLPDGSAIFSVEFKAVGQNGTSSSLSFAQEPTAIEASVNMAVATFAPQDGVIQVGSGIAAPRIKNPAQTGQGFVVSVSTAVGKRYVLEATDSLSAPNWTPVDSELGTGGVVTLRDTTAPAAQRFYRVRIE